eukprot:scaffold112403_cov78-Phaeocystis_antarctica.AAC.5
MCACTAAAASLICRAKKRPARSRMFIGRGAEAGAPSSSLTRCARLRWSVMRRVHCWNQKDSTWRRTRSTRRSVGDAGWHGYWERTRADVQLFPTLTTLPDADAADADAAARPPRIVVVAAAAAAERLCGTRWIGTS